MTRKAFLLAWALLGVGLLLPTLAQAQPTEDQRLKDLQERFKARFPVLQEAKKAGQLGERWDGYIEAVTPEHAKNPKIAPLVKDENADRKELYQILAKRENATPDKVAERNGKRNFEKAKTGEYLKTADSKWHQKK